MTVCACVKGMDEGEGEAGKTKTSAESTVGVQCGCPCSKICGLGEQEPFLCKHHIAELDRLWKKWSKTDSEYVDVTDNPLFVSHGITKKARPTDNGIPVGIIEKPLYKSLDEAAIAAANIIKYHICKGYDNVEYGISIYGDNEDVDTARNFCLAKTRLGYNDEVYSDYLIYTRKKYLFVADVHSHPICGVQEFSYGDYVLACGCEIGENGGFVLNKRSPHIKFLVGTPPIAWSVGRNYEKGEIVTYGGMFWRAKARVLVKFVDRIPYNKSSYWKRIKNYQNKSESHAYTIGEIILNRGNPGFFKKYSFWENWDNSEEPRYPHHVRWSGTWTLTKFTPPSLKPLVVTRTTVKGELNNEMLARMMHNEGAKNANDLTRKSGHEIIKVFNLTEQQMDVVEKWGSVAELKTRWRNVAL